MRKIYLYIVLWWNNYCTQHGEKKRWQWYKHRHGWRRGGWMYGCLPCLKLASEKREKEWNKKYERKSNKKFQVQSMAEEFKKL